MPSKQTQVEDSVSSGLWTMSNTAKAVYVCGFTGIGLYLVNRYIDTTTPVPWGCVVDVAVGQAIRMWCRYTLGLNTFTYKLSRPKRLITTGPYWAIRHPGYLGSIMIAYGTTCMFLDPVSRVVVLGITLYKLYSRMLDEEVMLDRTFGWQWREFASSRYKLVPYVC